MKHLGTVVAICVLALGLASAADAATKFTCNSAGKVWRMTPGISPIEITAMFVNGGTDCDLVVDDGAGFIVGLGICMESRYESVKVGPLPGVGIRVTAIKASGPNSKGYLRISDSFRVLKAGAGNGLREIGTARDLAKRDPAYARLLEEVKRHQRLKAPRSE